MDTQNINPIDQLKGLFKQQNVLVRLIIINLAIFVIVNIINLLFWLFQSADGNALGLSPMVSWFAVPSNIELLFLKPWTVITYMFLHEGFMHILFNMVMLYFGGRIFMEYLNDQKLLSTYIFGGLSGALLYIIAYNAFPAFSESVGYSVALGASASVLAVVIAIATYVPDYTVNLILIGRVKLKYIAIFLFVLDLLSIQRGNAGGHIAHIGGAIYGFMYIRLLKKGMDLSKYLRLPKFNLNWFKKGPKKAWTNPDFKARPISDDEYNKQKTSQQKDIDKILEKIAKSGYASLSKAEKDLLFRASNKK